MLGVTGRIFPVTHVHHAFRITFGLLANQEPVALLRVHIIDKSLAGLEIVTDTFRLILVASLLEYRLVLHFPGRVGTPYGMHDAAVHVHRDPIGLQLQIGIIYFTVTIQIGISQSGLESHRVGSRIFYRLVEHRLAHLSGVFRHRIRLYAVCDHRSDAIRCGNLFPDTVRNMSGTVRCHFTQTGKYRIFQ